MDELLQLCCDMMDVIYSQDCQLEQEFGVGDWEIDPDITRLEERLIVLERKYADTSKAEYAQEGEVTMPTEYTAKLMEEGQSFQEFALTCARNFGALIMMRDEPLDAPIPDEFVPSGYYDKKLEETTALLTELLSMTQEQQLEFGNAAKTEGLNRLNAWLRRERTQNARLFDMKIKVLGWIPPRTHQPLRDFMLQQIEVSMDTTDYVENAIANAEAMPPSEFYSRSVSNAASNIKRYTENRSDELRRTWKRNEWIKQLRDSLRCAEYALEG